eukprot:528860-Pleurochrysis_carterae.AAC.1
MKASPSRVSVQRASNLSNVHDVEIVLVGDCRLSVRIIPYVYDPPNETLPMSNRQRSAARLSTILYLLLLQYHSFANVCHDFCSHEGASITKL